MTENEAKKHLELCKTSRLFIPNNDVLEMAIQALEEKSSLMCKKKEELVKEIMRLEHNVNVMNERLNNQANAIKHYEQESRNKAIDEFMKQVEVEYDNDACPGVTDWMDYKISIRDLFRIAEEMRGAE